MDYYTAIEFVRRYNPGEGDGPQTLLRALVMDGDYWQGRTEKASMEIKVPEPVGKPQIFRAKDEFYLMAEIAKAQHEGRIPNGANAFLSDDYIYRLKYRPNTSLNPFSSQKDFPVQFFRGSRDKGKMIRLHDLEPHLSMAEFPIIYRGKNESDIEQKILVEQPLGKYLFPSDANKYIIGEGVSVRPGLFGEVNFDYSFAVQFCKINPNQHAAILEARKKSNEIVEVQKVH